MNAKDIIEVDIESSGMDGEGVARVDGRVVFIPYTLAGERVRAVVKSVKSRYAEASVIKVLSSSPSRVAPACPHYFKCGGCDMLHVTDEYRKNALLGELKNNLKKIAGIDCTPTASSGGGGFSDGGGAGKRAPRNKISMPFGYSRGHVVAGLFRRGTHEVVPVECMLTGELTRAVVRAVTEFADEKRLSVYNEKTGEGLLRHIVVREVGGRAAATLVINAERLGNGLEDELADKLHPEVDFFICPNQKKNNVILGDSVRLVRGNPRLAVCVLGVKAMLSPLSFFQVNDSVRDTLYKGALKHVSSRVLIDLYSGIGITSNLAAAKCEKVYAVECVPQAVADADETAWLNGNAHKIKNICGKAECVMPELPLEEDADILVDPPRKGCDPSVMIEAAKLRPRNLIYISCNHATMCRDVRVFLDRAKSIGAEYAVTECKLFDMFAGNHRAETLFCLARK